MLTSSQTGRTLSTSTKGSLRLRFSSPLDPSPFSLQQRRRTQTAMGGPLRRLRDDKAFHRFYESIAQTARARFRYCYQMGSTLIHVEERRKQVQANAWRRPKGAADPIRPGGFLSARAKALLAASSRAPTHLPAAKASGPRFRGSRSSSRRCGPQRARRADPGSQRSARWRSS